MEKHVPMPLIPELMGPPKRHKSSRKLKKGATAAAIPSAASSGAAGQLQSRPPKKNVKRLQSAPTGPTFEPTVAELPPKLQTDDEPFVTATSLPRPRVALKDERRHERK